MVNYLLIIHLPVKIEDQYAIQTMLADRQDSSFELETLLLTKQ